MADYSTKFVSSFLPSASSFGSNLRAFQSNFPHSTFKSVTIDPSGSDVIVIQPGSRFMKIGFANQAFPLIVPHVLAVPSSTSKFLSTDPRNEWEVDEDEVQERITERYRQARRKPPPNIYQSMKNYNRQSEFEEISAHNDAFLMEWTSEDDRKLYVGSSALHLNPESKYELIWPFQRGSFNCRDYAHVRDVCEDLGHLWRGAIEQELKVDVGDFEKYCIVLVLPDSFERAHIKGCVDSLMSGSKPFKAVTIIQEGQAVTFGCGVSSAIVVDCGAQKLSISCIEEGFLVTESRIKIPIGGDEITRLFGELLKLHEFPHEFDLNLPIDWELMDELKERCCTVNESEIAPSAAIFEFYVRKPSELTKKFLFKMYEERIIAPLALFEPEMNLLNHYLEDSESKNELKIDAFDLEDCYSVVDVPLLEEPAALAEKENTLTASASIQCNWNKCKESFDGLQAAFDHLSSAHLNTSSSDLKCKIPKCQFSTTNKISLSCHVLSSHFVVPSNPENQTKLDNSNCCDSITTLKENDHVPVALDEAIISSLLQLGESERIKKCASSIILSGGSHLFSGFSDLLHQKLASKLPLNPQTALVEAKIFPNARDLDARFLAWKGGAVFCKLESASESWITKEEWSAFGVRSIKEKISFIN